MIKEACVETLEQALNAQRNGADRIELCADLAVGGLSPTRELVEKISSELAIPMMVMVRPRDGNFVYSPNEIKQMSIEIQQLKQMNVAGIVLGCLKTDNTVDVVQTKSLAEAAQPLQVTFHKAIDRCSNIKGALADLLKLKIIDNVLTSGGHATAEAGKETLKSLVSQAKGRISIISAGKITQENLPELHRYIQGKAYHGRLIVGDLGNSKSNKDD